MPRMGELTAAQVWAAATRTLSAFAVKTLVDKGTNVTGYPSTQVAASATGGTFGSWGQISANIGTGKVLRGVWIDTNNNGDADWEVEIGEGASGSEAAVARIGGYVEWQSVAGKALSEYIPIWKALTDSARISARARNSNNSAKTYNLVLDVV